MEKLYQFKDKFIRVEEQNGYHQVILDEDVPFTKPQIFDNFRQRYEQNYNKGSFKTDDPVKIKENMTNDISSAFTQCLSTSCPYGNGILRSIFENYAGICSRGLPGSKLTVVSYMSGMLLSDFIIINNILRQNCNIKEIEYHQFVSKNDFEALAKPIEIDDEFKNERFKYFDVTRYRYACFLTFFKQLDYKINLYIHENIKSIFSLDVTPNIIMGIDYNDEAHSESFMFQLLVLNIGKKDTIIIDLRKHMDSPIDYLKGEYIASIKILNSDMGDNFKINKLESESLRYVVEKISLGYKTLDARTIIEFDTKSSYCNIKFVYSIIKTNFKWLFYSRH